jgi:hypothetical protein
MNTGICVRRWKVVTDYMALLKTLDLARLKRLGSVPRSGGRGKQRSLLRARRAGVAIRIIRDLVYAISYTNRCVESSVQIIEEPRCSTLYCRGVIPGKRM